MNIRDVISPQRNMHVLVNIVLQHLSVGARPLSEGMARQVRVEIQQVHSTQVLE
jgi:hypothetical protein